MIWSLVHTAGKLLYSMKNKTNWKPGWQAILSWIQDLYFALFSLLPDLLFVNVSQVYFVPNNCIPCNNSLDYSLKILL